MIRHEAFSVEPWSIRETALDLDILAQTESLFALSNGHLGWRANLDEGEPHSLPGTYLNGVFEYRPLPYAESAYGQPESGQAVINVTDGKLIRLFVDDEPFDVRYGTLRSHERVLDFRAGLLTRRAEWVSPAGGSVSIRSARLVSLTQRAIGAVSYEVEPLDRQARISVQSELLANEQLPPAGGDPRSGAVPDRPLIPEFHACHGHAVVTVHTTAGSRLRIGALIDHQFQAPADLQVETADFEDGGLVTASAVLRPGQRLRVVKFVGYGWSAVRSLQGVRDQVWAAISGARQAGWNGLVAEQRAYLDDFWDRADVQVDGDTEVQQAVRFALFHLLQAAARAEGRAVPAKGLTGPGYDGHAFWDTEAFVLPVLTVTAPDAAASALRWRHATLPSATRRARQLGLAGAAFPWRTIAGQECSGYWPAGMAAFHVNADIAAAMVGYLEATGDEEFGKREAIELLAQTARLWRSLGSYDAAGRFHIDGVTGPDEYSAIADDNVYTNLMAARNLRAAASLAEWYPDRARDLGISSQEAAGWRAAADAMHIPYDDALGVHPQAEGFTRHQVWDFERTPAGNYPLMLHYPYFELYRKQVVKQADLVLAMQMSPESFTAEQKARNFGYYERLTVRDSSLSACTQAVIAAEVGQLGLAYDYLGEAALMDLHDLERNTRDGVHLASLAGTWIALVAGFGGLRFRDGHVSFSPRLPEGLTRLAFTMLIRGGRLRVEVTRSAARYELADGGPLTVVHHGRRVHLRAGKPRLRRIPAAPAHPRPSQPAGREPSRRRPAPSGQRGGGRAARGQPR
jgi:alpha,alpha-trehalose phosphorylase